MKYLVNAIEFDFSDSQGELDEWEQDQIVKNNIGVWEADDEDDLIEEVTTSSGWCIKNIDYDIQLKQCHKVSSIPTKNGLLQYYKQKQTFFPIMKKVALKDVVQPTPNKNIKLSKVLDYLTDLGWEYTCNCMTRSGMQTYDELMQYVGVLDPNEHWNEDAYKDKCCDH